MTDATIGPGQPEREERLFAGYTGRLLWLTAIGAMVVLLGQFVFPLLLPVIIEDPDISPAGAGFVVTVIWLFTAVARYPGGRLADQLSRKTVLVGALAIAIVGLAVFAAFQGYLALVAGAVILGTGIGLYFPAALSQIADLFVDRRGQAMGIHIGLINIGGAVASALVLVVLAVAPWRATFLPLIAAIAVIAGLTHAWNAQPYVFDRRRLHLDLFATVGRLLKTPGMPWVVALLAAFNVMFQGLVNFLPTFLQFEKGFSPSLTSAAFASFFVVAAVANPLAGRIGDRFHHPVVAASASGITALGLVGVIVFESAAGVVLGMLVIGAAGTAVWPVMTAYIMDLVPADSMGGDFGALSTLYILIGSAGPTYVGVVAEQASYTTAFWTLVAGLLASIAVATWLAYAY